MSILPQNEYVKIILVFIAIFLIIITVLNVLKTQQPYNGQTCSDVQVPYTKQDCQNVQVPYSDNNCQSKNFAYNVVTSKCSQYVRGIFTPDPAIITCSLNNLEKEPGTFIMTYGFMIGGSPVVQTASLNMYSMGSNSKTYQYMGQIDSCVCSATPPQLQNCQQVIRYKTEQQCHNVTAYKTENQCHETVKYRTISIWESLVG